jgi:hypothetical protein
VWASSTGTVSNAYLGAAHGSAGVAMALGIWGRDVGCVQSLELARETFLRLYENGRTSDRIQLQYRLHSEVGTSPGIWCHGSAGYLWAILQAFGDDLLFRNPIDWAVAALIEAPLSGNAGYCHGMAGQLDLWTMLARHRRFSSIAARRAALAARLMGQLGLRTNDGWVWPWDESGQIRTDLWTGTLGPACALALYQSGRLDTLFCPDTLASVFQPRADGTLRSGSSAGQVSCAGHVKYAPEISAASLTTSSRSGRDPTPAAVP